MLAALPPHTGAYYCADQFDGSSTDSVGCELQSVVHPLSSSCTAFRVQCSSTSTFPSFVFGMARLVTVVASVQTSYTRHIPRTVQVQSYYHHDGCGKQDLV